MRECVNCTVFPLGFDGTSNVLAAKKFGIPPKGTHAHAFVSSFHHNESLPHQLLPFAGNADQKEPFVPVVYKYLGEVCKVLKISTEQTNKGELKAFVAYASAFPSSFLALIDTYDALK